MSSDVDTLGSETGVYAMASADNNEGSSTAPTGNSQGSSTAPTGNSQGSYTVPTDNKVVPRPEWEIMDEIFEWKTQLTTYYEAKATLTKPANTWSLDECKSWLELKKTNTYTADKIDEAINDLKINIKECQNELEVSRKNRHAI
jgi:hypothetical protein